MRLKANAFFLEILWLLTPQCDCTYSLFVYLPFFSRHPPQPIACLKKMEITNFQCVFPVSQNIVTRLCLIGIHSTFVLFFKDFHYVSLVHQWDHSFIICRFFCSNVRIRWYWWGVKFAFCLMLNYLFFPSLSPRINGKLSMMNIKNKKKISSNEIRSK